MSASQNYGSTENGSHEEAELLPPSTYLKSIKRMAWWCIVLFSTLLPVVLTFFPYNQWASYGASGLLEELEAYPNDRAEKYPLDTYCKDLRDSGYVHRFAPLPYWMNAVFTANSQSFISTVPFLNWGGMLAAIAFLKIISAIFYLRGGDMPWPKQHFFFHMLFEGAALFIQLMLILDWFSFSSLSGAVNIVQNFCNQHNSSNPYSLSLATQTPKPEIFAGLAIAYFLCLEIVSFLLRTDILRIARVDLCGVLSPEEEKKRLREIQFEIVGEYSQAPEKNDMVCPISLGIIRRALSEKVFTAEQEAIFISYEEEAILEWLSKHSQSPVTRNFLTREKLQPNPNLETRIAAFVDSQFAILKQCPEVRDAVLEKEKPQGCVHTLCAVFFHKNRRSLLQAEETPLLEV